MKIFSPVWLWFAVLGVLTGCAQSLPTKAGKPALSGVDSGSFVKIPSGCFYKGNEHDTSQSPPKVCLNSFYIQKTEVTQKEFAELMSEVLGTTYCPAWGLYFGLGPTLPAYNIHWNNAILYCNKLSKARGLDTVYQYDSIGIDNSVGAYTLYNLRTNHSIKGYRLPTDSEWEYACKAGSHNEYFWGDRRGAQGDSGELTLLDLRDYNDMEPGIREYAWYFKNSGNRVHQVATKRPNNWGLYDMIGNVSEWTEEEQRRSGNGPSNNTNAVGAAHFERGGASIKCGNCEGEETKYTTWYRVKASSEYGKGAISPTGFRVVLPAE
jgi:formylglycine-generating enzyme required for sulfatase activity